MKLLRRTVFCRESDFERKIKNSAMRYGYTRATWSCITISKLHKMATWQALQGAQLDDQLFVSSRDGRGLTTWWAGAQAPRMCEHEVFARRYIEFLHKSQQLYSSSWSNWSWQFYDDQICIRWNSNKDWEPLGIAVLERDY